MFRKIRGWVLEGWKVPARGFPEVDHGFWEAHIWVSSSQPTAQVSVACDRSPISSPNNAARETDEPNKICGIIGRERSSCDKLLKQASANTVSPDEIDALLSRIADPHFDSQGVPKSRMLTLLAESFRWHARKQVLMRRRTIDYYATIANETNSLSPPDRPDIFNILVDTISDFADDESFLAFDIALDAVRAVPSASQAELLCRLCDRLRSLKLAGERPQRLLQLIELLAPAYRRDPLVCFGAAINFLREDLRPGFIHQIVRLSAVCTSENQSAIISSLARCCLNGLEGLEMREKILRIMIDAESLNGARGQWSSAHQNCLWILARAASQLAPLHQSVAVDRVRGLFEQIPAHLRRVAFRTLLSE